MHRKYQIRELLGRYLLIMESVVLMSIGCLMESAVLMLIGGVCAAIFFSERKNESRTVDKIKNIS